MSKTTTFYASKNISVSDDRNFNKPLNLFMNDKFKSLLYFNISSIPENATIVFAKLSIYLYRYDFINLSDSTKILISKLNSSFDKDNVTNLTLPPSSPLLFEDTNYQTINKDNINKFVVFDNLTTTVASWYADSSSNHGFQLSTSDESIISFFSKDYSDGNLCPKLEVSYAVGLNAPALETTLIEETIYQSKLFIESSIQDISSTFLFNYFINNSIVDSTIKNPGYVSVLLKGSDSRDGVFENIGNSILIPPGTNKIIEVSSMNKYICLSIKGTIGTILTVTSVYKNIYIATPPVVKYCNINDDKIILTMTKPLLKSIADPTAFAINSPTSFAINSPIKLPVITITEALISNDTITLTCSDNAIFFFGTTLSYKATGTNDLTGITETVFNFNNQAIKLDMPLIIDPTDTFILSDKHINTAIYDVSKARSFKYLINITPNTLTSINIIGSSSRTIGRSSILKDFKITDTTPKTFVLSFKTDSTNKYIHLSFAPNKSNSKPSISVTPIYIPYSANDVPSIVLSGKIISNGSKILLLMSKPLTNIYRIIPDKDIFIITPTLSKPVIVNNFSIHNNHILLSLSSDIKDTDFIYLSYNGTNANELTGLNGNVDNFKNILIGPFLETTSCNQKLLVHSSGAQSTLYDTSKATSFTYKLTNNSTSNILLITLQNCSKRNGIFRNIDNELLLSPNSSKDIMVLNIYPYVRLYARNYISSTVEGQLDLTASYNAISKKTPSCVFSAGVVPPGMKIVLAMTKPLYPVNTTANLADIFNICTTFETNVTLKSLTVNNTTVYLELNNPIKIDSTTDFISISYKSTDTINYLTGVNGPVDDFTDYRVDLNVEKVEVLQTLKIIKSTLSELDHRNQSTIYDIVNSLSFKYTITNKSQSNIFVILQQSDNRSMPIANLDPILTFEPGSSKEIEALNTSKYVSLLAFKDSEESNDSFIDITSVYTAYPNLIPSRVIHSTAIENGAKILLTMSKSLNECDIQSPSNGVFTITTSLDTSFIVIDLLVLDKTVTLILNTPIKNADFITLTYTATSETNYLTGINGDVNNFTNSEVEIYVESVDITQKINIIDLITYSNIYDVSKATSFKYNIGNHSKSNIISVDLQTRTTRADSFISTNDIRSINPGESLELPVLTTSKYVYLVMSSNLKENSLVDLNVHYTASPHKIAPRVLIAEVFQNGLGIFLTMTSPVQNSNPVIDPAVFSITNSFNQLLEIKNISILNGNIYIEFNNPINIFISPSDSMSLTYKSTDSSFFKNDIVDVDNFTDEPIAMLVEYISFTELFNALPTVNQTSIFYATKVLALSYTIVNTSIYPISITPYGCDTKNGVFTPLSDSSIVNENSELTIELLKPPTLTSPNYVYLDYCISQATPFTPSDNIKLPITTNYTAFTISIPSTVISAKSIENGAKVELIMSKSLSSPTSKSFPADMFTIVTSLAPNITVNKITILDKTVTLKLNKSIPTVFNTNDFIWLTYKSPPTSYLTGPNGDVDNFTNQIIDFCSDIVVITQKISPILKSIQTTIYGTEHTISFKYIIKNNSKFNTALVTLQQSDSRYSSFYNVDPMLSILPGSTLEFLVDKKYKYVCLLATNTFENAENESLEVTVNYTAYVNKIPPSPTSIEYSIYYSRGYILQIVIDLNKPIHKVDLTFNDFTINPLPEGASPYRHLFSEHSVNLFFSITNKHAPKNMTLTYKATRSATCLTSDTGDIDNFTDLPIK